MKEELEALRRVAEAVQELVDETEHGWSQSAKRLRHELDEALQRLRALPPIGTGVEK